MIAVRPIMPVIGPLLLVLAAAMLVPAVVDIAADHGDRLSSGKTAPLPGAAKWLLCLAILLSRQEIVTLRLLVTLSLWSR